MLKIKRFINYWHTAISIFPGVRLKKSLHPLKILQTMTLAELCNFLVDFINLPLRFIFHPSNDLPKFIGGFYPND